MAEIFMSELVTPVSFSNKKNEVLYGMLHQNRQSSTEFAVIILSPGIKSRVAPHRLYVKMSNLFSEMGLTTLRFDPSGLGDSEGEVEAELAADVYGSIQVGRYIDDTIAAMDWMQKNYNYNNFIVAGLCGGAITGLLTATKDDRVDSLVSLGIPVILDSSDIDHNQFITTGQLKELRGVYLKKLFDLNSWFRFLTFKSDFKLMIKSISQPIKSKLEPYFNNKEPANDGGGSELSNSASSNFNPLFPEAFINFVSNHKILLIFSEADRLYWEYDEKFLANYKDRISQYLDNIDLFVVPYANHVFSFSSWQDELFTIIKQWLINNYFSLK